MALLLFQRYLHGVWIQQHASYSLWTRERQGMADLLILGIGDAWIALAGIAECIRARFCVNNT
ncbi:hypothetical protein C2U29_12440 [Aeromonas veronii]|nr:hypothetical protein A6033_02125 [Aeromonas veronii]PNW67207.1 hypothetical protein C2U29_12440 [Aeromonas veronii]POG17883.1 hypothetical protein C2849_16850 [Aeromonas veronii]RRA94393.1 hypothetical protein AVS_02160 [Aeromonas veronii bv. sobria]